MNTSIISRGSAALAATALITAAIAAPAFPSSAPTAGKLTGAYKTTIAGDRALGGHLNGTWTITFAKSGRYTVREDSRVGERGTAAITVHRITFGHETGFLACPGSGIYKWKLTGKRLKFTRIKDSACPGRAGVLAHTFTKVS